MSIMASKNFTGISLMVVNLAKQRRKRSFLDDQRRKVKEEQHEIRVRKDLM